MTKINEEKFYKSVEKIVNLLRKQDAIVAVNAEQQLLFCIIKNGVLLQSDKQLNRKTAYLSLMVFMELYDTIPLSTDRGTSDWGYFIRHTL